MGQQHTRRIDHSYFAPCPVSRVKAHDNFPFYRGCKEQILEIAGKNVQSLAFRFVRKEVTDFSLYGRANKAFVSVLRRLSHQIGCRGVQPDIAGLDRGYYRFFRDFNLHCQRFFFFAPIEGQNAVGHDFGHRFTKIKVHGINRRLVVGTAGGNHAFPICKIPHLFPHLSIIGYNLGDNVQCPVESSISISYTLVRIDKGSQVMR